MQKPQDFLPATYSKTCQLVKMLSLHLIYTPTIFKNKNELMVDAVWCAIKLFSFTLDILG